MNPIHHAIKEIREVLKKHDLAGVVMIQDTLELAYLKEVSPSWSCASLSADGEFRIKANREDFPSKESQKACIESTLGMVLGFMNESERNHKDFSHIVAMFSEHFDFSHFERRN